MPMQDCCWYVCTAKHIRVQECPTLLPEYHLYSSKNSHSELDMIPRSPSFHLLLSPTSFGIAKHTKPPNHGRKNLPTGLTQSSMIL
jgi:hypothetical protein